MKNQRVHLSFKHNIKEIEKLVGKRIAGDYYIHRMYVSKLSDETNSLFVSAKKKLSSEQDRNWNIVKINLRKKRVSFLVYPSFDIEAHPELEMSISINLSVSPPSVRETKGRGFILHRKELFVNTDYNHYSLFAEFTKNEEKLGLLDSKALFKGEKLGTIMGRKHIWEEWLKFKGVKIKDHYIIRES